MNARRILLERLIDHAPMFPPARLPLPEALADHRAARASDESWMLARFVAPSSRIGDLPEDLPVSAVLDSKETPDGVEAVEVRASEPEVIRDFPHVDAELFFEISDPAFVTRIAARGASAKVRCGGGTVPSVPELAAFIRACGDAGVAFKATAGLHHPVRRDGEHGFLNLLAAAASDDVERMLESEDPEELLAVDATRARQALRSIGSCSFWEPVDELKALGVLPL